MSMLNPAITTRESTRRESRGEIQLVTWDDFFPSRTDTAEKPYTPITIPLASTSPSRRTPATPETASRSNVGEKRRISVQRTLKISRRSALAKRRSETLGQDVAESPLLHLATAEIGVGNKEKARQLLKQVLQADPHSERGWFWMAKAVDSEEEQRFCLKQVLSIDRHNVLARRRLEALATGAIRPKIAEHPVEDVKVEPSASESRLLNLRATLQKYAIPTAIIYLGVLTIAEAFTTLTGPQGGLVLYGILLTILVSHTALTWDHPGARLILTLVFVPLTRMASLFLLLTNFPMIYSYVITSMLLLAAAVVVLRTFKILRQR
jgi:hypothetical protein